MSNVPPRPQGPTLRLIPFSPVALYVAVLFLCYGLAFVYHGDLDSAQTMSRLDLIPYDSVSYVGQAENLQESQLDLIAIAFGALNWQTLAVVYYAVNDTIGHANVAFVIANTFAVYVILSVSGAMFAPYRLQWRTALVTVVLSPYLIGWVLAPNKELPMAAFTITLVRAIGLRRFWVAAVVAVAAAPFKMQIFVAAAIFCVGYKLPKRALCVLVGTSLVLPAVLSMQSGMTMETFVANASEEVRSALYFTKLDNINRYIGGFVIVGPIRIVCNLIAGGYPIRLIENHTLGTLIAPLTSFFQAFVVLAFCIKAHLHKWLGRAKWTNVDAVFYVYCVAIVLAFIPFLQPRYYWWIIPIMVAAIFSRPMPVEPVPARSMSGRRHVNA